MTNGAIFDLNKDRTYRETVLELSTERYLND